jgi:structural maintenance of chromosome 2
LQIRYNQIKEVLNGKIHEAETIKAKMEQSGHHQHLSQLQSLEETVANEQSNLNRAKSALGKARKDLEEIESKIENLKGLPEQELKEAENKLAAAKARVEEASSNAHANGQEKDTLQLEVADLESSMAAQLKQIDGVLALVEELEMKVGEDKAHLDEKNKLKFEAIDSLNKHKAVLKEKNKELHKHEKQLKELQAKLSECLLKIKENEHKMSSCIKENKEAAMKVESLLSKYDWIATEKDQFGLSGSAYDFNAFNVREANQKCAQLNEQKTKLSKNVNMRAMNMLGKAEEKYNDLKKKKKIVESDKAKITELIYELDQKKNETLVSAWEKVNKVSIHEYIICLC